MTQTQDHRIAGLEAALKTQVVLLEGLCEVQNRLQQALLSRDWTALEELVEDQDAIAGRIGEAETLREDAYRQLRNAMGVSESESFADVLALLDGETRGHLANLYRRLKVAVLRVRSIGSGIEAYSRNAAELGEAIVSELLPGGRGRMYNPRGQKAAGDRSAIVMSHHA